MHKTKKIDVTCDKAEVNPDDRRTVIVSMGNPLIDKILDAINEEDLIKWLQEHKTPEDIFSQTELEKWAAANDFIKEEKF